MHSSGDGMRTDRNNNPTAFTTAIAKEAGLNDGVDYEQGDPFQAGNQTYYTAKLLGDPLKLTIQVIDKIGFRTINGYCRWTYVQMPTWIWSLLNTEQKIQFVAYMYRNEGGTTMKGIFV